MGLLNEMWFDMINPVVSWTENNPIIEDNEHSVRFE
jgi:hypothetical protein